MGFSALSLRIRQGMCGVHMRSQMPPGLSEGVSYVMSFPSTSVMLTKFVEEVADARVGLSVVSTCGRPRLRTGTIPE